MAMEQPRKRGELAKLVFTTKELREIAQADMTIDGDAKMRDAARAKARYQAKKKQ